MYLSPGTWVRFPRKAKIPIVKGVGEDREVAVPGTPKARAVTPCMYEKQVGWVVLEHNERKQVHEFGRSYMKSVLVWKLSGCNRAYVSVLKLQFPGGFLG
ncbi:hypothetical protein QL285_004186 [Trifolium repens]|nr:hypothetical protein QL285_004186 [Trifolium repens]